MPESHPAVIDRYFTLAAQRDTDALMALFADDADVVDQGLRHRGIDAIRLWRDGVATADDHTTTILGTVVLGDHGHRINARLDGNFPGGTVDMAYRFTTDEDQITRLQIGG
jgi:ketosteroid isomerase-like protein